MSVVKFLSPKETMSVPFTCHDDIEYTIIHVEGKADEFSFNNSTQQFNSDECELDIHFKSKGNTHYWVTLELDQGLYDIDLDAVVELLRDEISDKYSDIEIDKKILTKVLAERKQ
ncbi:hypothetical protein [uncultured Mediterranean phage uvMED]|nr:hypothetical protein [uncultured Mediterranean phage uvMED]BAR16500.1 hypothetical protein [uncultured Mediterranean phage uvMED]